MKIYSKFVLFILTIFSLNSCTKDNTTKAYIFIGHCYDWNGRGKKVDDRIEAINIREYDEVWLGGDICSETSSKVSTLQYLDDIFQISKNTTLWAVGNHDIRSKKYERISKVTGRKLYYAQTDNGITKLVINTNIEHPVFKENCDYREKQFVFINQVLDTVVHSSHLVLLMHHIVWEDVEEDMGAREAANAASAWVKFSCQPKSWFRLSIYPKLKEIQKKGVQVVVISGDGGQKSKQYFFKAPNGIEFYISGINNSCDFENNPKLEKRFNTNPDSILIFRHDIKKKTLTGKFVPLD